VAKRNNKWRGLETTCETFEDIDDFLSSAAVPVDLEIIRMNGDVGHCNSIIKGFKYNYKKSCVTD
jgi:hypothetical protein